MKTLKDIIHAVLANSETESLVTRTQVNALTDELMGAITGEKEVTDAPAYAHVTVIMDDGNETIIWDFQKMKDFDMTVDYPDSNPEFYGDYGARRSPNPDISSVAFHGKPVPNKDGSQYTEIRRAK